MNQFNLVVLCTILIISSSILSISAQSNFQSEQKWSSQNNNGIKKVLAGDFNAPRGQEMFDTIAQNYKDNIPLHDRIS